jgi:hypothetical protein
MRGCIRRIALLCLVGSSIGSAGLKGAVSNSPNKLISLDAECASRWNEKKSSLTKVDDKKERVSDEEIGMTEFVNKKLKSIGGTIRTTWSDYRILELRERDQKVYFGTSFSENQDFLS